MMKHLDELVDENGNVIETPMSADAASGRKKAVDMTTRKQDNSSVPKRFPPTTT